MKIVKTPGMLCLAAYLIVVGLVNLFGIGLGVLSFLPAVLALAAGGLLLVGK